MNKNHLFGVGIGTDIHFRFHNESSNVRVEIEFHAREATKRATAQSHTRCELPEYREWIKGDSRRYACHAAVAEMCVMTGFLPGHHFLVSNSCCSFNNLSRRDSDSSGYMFGSQLALPQVVPVLEVPIEAAFGDTQVAGQPLDPHSLNALLPQHLQRTTQPCYAIKCSFCQFLNLMLA